jgi:hypothetical protein
MQGFIDSAAADGGNGRAWVVWINAEPILSRFWAVCRFWGSGEDRDEILKLFASTGFTGLCGAFSLPVCLGSLRVQATPRHEIPLFVIKKATA